MIYESTRNPNLKLNASEAILQGLSNDGGLFVLRDLKKQQINLEQLMNKNYYEITSEILKLFLDFTDEEIHNCVNKAYQNKFTSDKITPLKSLSNTHILELFHGPTSAFKDIGLSLLPQLITTALKKTNTKEDILILTATSGDTGKAALEGFKNVDKTKIMVFYPNDGVSTVQKLQMQTQDGNNTKVCAIHGNFDDAQTGVKNLFTDEAFQKDLLTKNLKLSSANSINIGRLIPQIVYYFVAYFELVNNKKIKLHEEVNFCVPTGNFGNILAGYYANLIGLPINKLICASNSNNILYDFLTTGVYDRNRPFLKTNSPSMDILISSNLERLLYYISDEDNQYVKSLMDSLNTTGRFEVSKEILAKIQAKFQAGFCNDNETLFTIKNIYQQENYLLDTHTAVAYKVLLENFDSQHQNIILSTASPYKFSASVIAAISSEREDNELDLLQQLHSITNVEIPNNLKNLDQKPIRHQDLIDKTELKNYVLQQLEHLW